MDFYNKYLKYKSKYLGLKNNFSFIQNGGAEGGVSNKLVWKEDSTFEKKIVDICKEKKGIELNLSDWVRTDIDGLNIIKKSFDETSDKPVLVVMAGISTNSFCGSAEIVVDKVDLLKDKFKAVYIINTNKYKDEQNDACGGKSAVIEKLKKRCEFEEKENNIRRKMKAKIKD